MLIPGFSIANLANIDIDGYTIGRFYPNDDPFKAVSLGGESTSTNQPGRTGRTGRTGTLHSKGDLFTIVDCRGEPTSTDQLVKYDVVFDIEIAGLECFSNQPLATVVDNILKDTYALLNSFKG